MPNFIIKKLLGEKLINRNGESLTVDSVFCDGKIFGLFFSAHWCPPCRSFAAELVKFYERRATKSDFEVIFVSSDNDEVEYRNFFDTMPWLSLPYEERERKLLLTKKLHVQGIPTLVLIDGSNGHIITASGTELIADDPEGINFPWRPRSLRDIFTECSIIKNDGKPASPSSFEDSIKGLYFSAHWCPPCKAFTPQLAKVYENLHSNGHNFEVIFVSSDRSKESFEQYFRMMPWLAISFENEKQRKELATLFGVQGIPTLVLVDKNNLLITKDGRFEINEDPKGEKFPWKPELVAELTEKFAHKLHENPCLVIFTEGDPREMELFHNRLLPVAEETLNGRLNGSDNLNLHFFTAGDTDIADSLREFAQLEDEVPQLTIMDFTEEKYYILEDDIDISTDVIRTFVEQFYLGNLKGKPLRL